MQVCYTFCFKFCIAYQSSIINMECAVILLICTFLSPRLTTPSAGALSDFFPTNGLCSLSPEERLEVQRQIQNGVAIANAGGVTIPECGPGPWLQIANFDFASTSPPCPTEWEPISLGSGFGGCRRPETAAGCSVATFTTGGVEYGKVCGRIIGAATASPDGFAVVGPPEPTETDGITLVDGVTLTHSSPIQHIWTLSAATNPFPDNVICPCKDNGASQINAGAVAFADGNYFCDTTFGGTKLLWNGQCSTVGTLETCCAFNTPPFFTATLPTRTSDNADARLCRNENEPAEDVRVQIMQLYVQ